LLIFSYINPMNNIGIGIFCFGESYYYKGTIDKLNHFLPEGFHCYILTENPSFFESRYTSDSLHTILYDRSFKSYHDKMILPRHVLKNHDFCFLIDADTHITDYSFLTNLKTYEFKYGITYVDTLKNHSANREFVKDLITDNPEWNSYKIYAEQLFPSFAEYQTIWEYFLIINKIGFIQNKFYNYYEKLQVIKEFCDTPMNKQVNGAGEGISMNISAQLSGSDIQRDMDLYELIKDKMISISRRHTNPNLWPSWMK
jgi:hypothetical protein